MQFGVVWVDDLVGTLEVARRLGATVVTEPTEFSGDTFSRFLDPYRNLWWVYQRGTGADSWAASTDSAADNAEWAAGEAGAWAEEDTSWEPTPELSYIHDTLITAMKGLRE